MYILRLKQEDNILYFVAPGPFGMPAISTEIKDACQFASYEDAKNAKDSHVFNFEIMEI